MQKFLNSIPGPQFDFYMVTSGCPGLMNPQKNESWYLFPGDQNSVTGCYVGGWERERENI